MDVEFEILIVLNITLLFTVIYIISKVYKPIENFGMIFSFLSAICWFVLGIGFMATNPTFPPFAYLFVGIGLILSIFTVFDVVSLLGERSSKRFSTEI